MATERFSLIKFKRSLLSTLLAAFFCFTQNLYAEFFTFNDFDFGMDIPEGFEITEASPEGDSFFFETKLMPVKFALKFYSTEIYPDAKKVISDTLTQLSANGQIEEIDWYGRKCYLSTFQFVMPDQKLYSGWMFSIQVQNINNPSQKMNMIFLTYCDSQVSQDCDQYMLSIIDNIFFCSDDLRRPGPVTTFAFPPVKDTDVTLNIGGKTISSKIDQDAIERSKFVLEREYAVLTIYANQKMWKEAWQRYYRILFRESYSALDGIAKDIYKALLPVAQRKSFDEPEFEILKMCMDWVQDFQYERDRKGTDFTPVTASIQGAGSDCDSRSMLMCILMEHFGIKSELFISREYSHAVFGLALDKPGAAIEVDGINYVLGETTAKVDFGLIAQDQSDTKKWIPVDLP